MAVLILNYQTDFFTGGESLDLQLAMREGTSQRFCYNYWSRHLKLNFNDYTTTFKILTI